MKVRFAPSPTGFLHIGGARTALFNWMYAKSQNGKFVLRIEDTDLQRSEKKFEEEILNSMEWLGLHWDELYHQSERFDIYREHAQRLLEEGKAYKDGEAILLKMIPDEQIKLYDLIRGEIEFDSNELKDQVLLKSDGSPAYSFCCVVDDALMEISHVIRGEDHISNTPKQMIIYQALGWKVPKYAHLPLIMGEDNTRLSKRSGAVAVSDYRKNGFLSEGLINYLMLLGWSPGNNQEKISLDKAVKNFSIKKVNKAAAIFSMDKLKWLNGEYIKTMETGALTEQLMSFLFDRGVINQDFDRKTFESIVDLFKDRMQTFEEFADRTDYFFSETFRFDEEAKEKHLTPDRADQFVLLVKKLEELDSFTTEEVEAAFKEGVKDLGLKTSELVYPVRVALTGKGIGPSLFHIMSLLGKDQVVKRLQHAF